MSTGALVSALGSTLFVSVWGFVSSWRRGLKYQQIDFHSSPLAEPNLIQASMLIVRRGRF